VGLGVARLDQVRTQNQERGGMFSIRDCPRMRPLESYGCASPENKVLAL